MTERSPKTVTELVAVLTKLAEGPHSYGSSADAMWRGALAAFNFVADRVGATGFQASYAALKFYGEAMHVQGPFIVLKLEDVLYPQYDLPGRLAEFIDEQAEWLAEQAREKLAQDPSYAAETVRKHWEALAATPVCQVARPGQRECEHQEDSGYYCEVRGEHTEHRVGYHTRIHALMGNGYTCDAVTVEEDSNG